MMAAYQPQQGAMHPGMPHGHPGMAGAPGQHMGHPMMQPGVSGPGQPHVTQPGAMMAMHPGANGMGGAGMPGGQHPGLMGMPGQQGQGMAATPGNAHAMSNLTQQQQQQMMLHQQQLHAQQMSNQQQAAMMRQRQLQQQVAAQQNGMMGMQQGMPGGMTPQQLIQLQQQSQAGAHMVTLPPHLRNAQQQLQHSHQSQAAQMQQMAMQQQANSQHQQNPQGQPGPPNQQGQPHPPQMRPQSRMANPNEQGQVQQQAQQQQQNAQQPQPGQQPQQAPQGSQAPGQQPGQATAQPQGNPPQGASMNPAHVQQLARLQQQRQMQMMQIQQAQQRQAMQAQQQTVSGLMVLRILLMGDQLSGFNANTGKDIAAWSEFVDKHFAPEGRLLHSFDDNPNGKTKQYEVLRPTIARYFWTYFESGASGLRLHTENAREQPLPNGRSQVMCGNATLTVSYPSGARLEMHGTLNTLFAPNSNMIECMELQQTSSEEIMARAEVEKILSTWSTNANTKSPKMAKNKLPKAQQKLQQQQAELTIDHFPKVPKGSMGTTSRVQQFLEIGETMNVMSELMVFANERKMRPEVALDAWTQQYDSQGQQGNPQINLPPNGSPMVQRTPSMQNMQMPPNQGNFTSPMVSNMNLPMQNGMNGSPHLANNAGLQPGMAGMQPNSHTPSPHQSNMAAPPMMPQHSQQGTNSSAASATTSPNVNNQKRRRSTVKLEDGSGGQGDGAGQGRVKASPRPSKKNKPGG